MKLRDYQLEDLASVLRLHETKRSLLVRHACGLGKSLLIAAAAGHYSQFGIVLALVDSRKLVRQNAKTIYQFTGIQPGIEMGEERAVLADGPGVQRDRIICGTIQSQYSGGEGSERRLNIEPTAVSCLILDEGESCLAPRFREVVDWYMQNPNLKVLVLTATPKRTDGVAMANLCDAVAGDRDIRWGIDNGWLVDGEQSFIHVSVDWSSLSIRPDEDGVHDYSSEGVASLINNEPVLIEIAQGIIGAVGDRKTIVVLPTVDTARAVADYLSGERPGCARCVYGDMGDTEREDVFSAHQNGEFQFLSSCMLCSKGYNDPSVMALVNCRKTRSKRLYEQIVGRVVRPLDGILEGLDSPVARKAAIAASSKPFALVCNMVGIADDVKDMTLVDLLGDASDEEVVERAKKIQLDEGLDTEEAVEKAEAEIGEQQEAERLLAELDEIELESGDFERAIRRRVQVKSQVHVEREGNLGAAGLAGTQADSYLPPQQLGILKRFKVPDKVISRMSPADVKSLSQTLIVRQKHGLCSYGQAAILRRYGFDKGQLKAMRRETAKTEIDAIAANGWRKVSYARN